ncbi:hypothetical protein MMC22_005766 [Lobaria immixta]|nr:hypothetical protein [Lobaria immixta]
MQRFQEEARSPIKATKDKSVKLDPSELVISHEQMGTMKKFESADERMNAAQAMITLSQQTETPSIMSSGKGKTCPLPNPLAEFQSARSEDEVHAAASTLMAMSQEQIPAPPPPQPGRRIIPMPKTFHLQSQSNHVIKALPENKVARVRLALLHKVEGLRLVLLHKVEGVRLALLHKTERLRLVLLNIRG